MVGAPLIAASEGIDGCPTFAQAYSGFPVELAGVGELHAAFLNESRTRGCWWSPVQEIRIRGPKKMGEAQRPLSVPDSSKSTQDCVLDYFQAGLASTSIAQPCGNSVDGRGKSAVDGV